MRSRRTLVPALALILTASTVGLVGWAPAAAEPTTVTIAGSFQSELGCPGDWMPECAVSHLTFAAEDAVWQATFDLPAGSWEYKAALNDGWNESYGAHAGSALSAPRSTAVVPARRLSLVRLEGSRPE